MKPHRIVRIETAIPHDAMPGLLALRVQTDSGLIGSGETYYAPHAVAGMIHDWMARYLLGQNALAIEALWRFLYERATNFGSRGAELRAISAIDVALWDIFGQAVGQPVWQLLGGQVQAQVRTYNSCGGPSYGARPKHSADAQLWPGYGEMGEKGPLNDYWMAMNEPEALAEELLAAGYEAMKIWPLDAPAHKPGGPLHISWEDLGRGLAPYARIRQHVGKRIELMFDGHGFFQLAAAQRIAQGLQEFDLLWAEDLLRVDSIDTLADFRPRAGVPLAVSEMLSGPDDYRLVLEKQAADFIMIDPTWAGGVSGTRNITRLAQFYNVPVLMHDCTGPFTLLSGLQVAVAAGNVAWQESVRAHLQLLYPQLIDQEIRAVAGRLAAPTRSGIGAAWLDRLFQPEGGLRSSVLAK